MIPLSEAQTIITANMPRLDVETVRPDLALGRTLAAPLIARRDNPPAHVSAMDGYAVRSGDLGGRPFDLIGESAAGAPHEGELGDRQAVRISTGAIIPVGADQVVIQEKADQIGYRVSLDDTPRPGAHIRKQGGDFSKGGELARAGSRVTADLIALAAASGAETIQIRRAPRIALLSTGDELKPAFKPAGPLDIINSNAPGLAALIGQWSGQAELLGIAPDDPAAIRKQLEAARDFDLLVTIGGASVGDHDHLRAVYAEMEGDPLFEKIAVKPGKPCWFGPLGDGHVLGLPGNPVSAMVMARLLLWPAMQAMAGANAALPMERATLAAPIGENGPREHWMRGRMEAGRVLVLGNQDSAAISRLAEANVLIRRPAHAAPVESGARIDILRL